MCLGSTGISAGDMASRMAGCGRDMRSTAVCGSGVSTLSTGASMVWNGWFCLTAMTENATSSDVTGLPSWNSASLRRCSVSVRASGDSSQDSARYGCGFQSASKRSGLAKSCALGSAVATPDCTAPFRWRGTCVEPITSVPPVLGVSAAPAEPSANAASKPARICLALRMSLPLESWSIGRFVHADGLGSSSHAPEPGLVPKRRCRWCQ